MDEDQDTDADKENIDADGYMHISGPGHIRHARIWADGWQQDTAQQWFYMEHDKKVVNRWVTWADGTPRYQEATV